MPYAMKSEVLYIPDVDELDRSYIFAAKLLGGSFLISESVLKSYILALKLLSKILFHVDLLFEAESFVIESLCEAMA
eukprot:scaffold3481_cov75-Cyclotella_meneghiniana.AAC.1